MYAVPPSVGVGSATARFGTSCAPSTPPTRLKPTSPSFVIEQNGESVERGQGWDRSTPRRLAAKRTFSAPPRCSDARRLDRDVDTVRCESSRHAEGYRARRSWRCPPSRDRGESRSVAPVRHPDVPRIGCDAFGPASDRDQSPSPRTSARRSSKPCRPRGSPPRRSCCPPPRHSARRRRRSASAPDPERGSRATTLAEEGDTIQTRPKPTATPDAPMTCRERLRYPAGAGAIRDTVPSAEFVTQTAPSP